GLFAHTGFFAQLLSGADTRAHPAQNVLGKNGFRRAQRIAGIDLADKERDIDGGGTRIHARRIVTEVASVRFDKRLAPVERRMKVAVIGVAVRRFEPPAPSALLQTTLCHLDTVSTIL